MAEAVRDGIAPIRRFGWWMVSVGRPQLRPCAYVIHEVITQPICDLRRRGGMFWVDSAGNVEMFDCGLFILVLIIHQHWLEFMAGVH